MATPIKILIINPNTSETMTDGLRRPIDKLQYNNTTYTYFTSPSRDDKGGIPSINNPEDALASSTYNLPFVIPLLASHDAVLIACFSPHPLVDELKRETCKPVLGIFEASALAAVQICANTSGSNSSGRRSGFGIVTTGAAWREPLNDAVKVLLPNDPDALCINWLGVECCGIDAGDLHPSTADGRGEGDDLGSRSGQDEGAVEKGVKRACRRLVERANVECSELRAVILGCAGMVGMDTWVNDVVGKDVKIIDGVSVGVGILQTLVRSGL